MTPRVEDAIAHILPALQKVFATHLRAAIVKGSAIKDDFIPYYSDLDLHAFLDRASLLNDMTPRPELALAFQEAIGALQPEDYGFASFQIFFLTAEFPADWAPPPPGTYRVLLGDPQAIFGEPTPARLIENARWRLDQIAGELSSFVRSMVDKPNRALGRLSRSLGAYLKGQIYNAAVVIAGDPLRVWRSGLDEVIPVLNPVGSPAIQTFFSEVRSWPQRRDQLDYHRVLLHQGLRAMGDLAAWWDATRDASRP